jgi:hypothetical protein
MSGQQRIKHIARFLRGINAVQNDRNAVRFLQHAYNFALTNFALFEPVIVRGCKLATPKSRTRSTRPNPSASCPIRPQPAGCARSHRAGAEHDALFPVRTSHIKSAIKRLILAEQDLVQ